MWLVQECRVIPGQGALACRKTGCDAADHARLPFGDGLIDPIPAHRRGQATALVQRGEHRIAVVW